MSYTMLIHYSVEIVSFVDEIYLLLLVVEEEKIKFDS